MSVTLTLEDEIDVSRGDMIVRPANVPQLKQKVDAMVVWMAEEPMLPGKQYTFKTTTKMVVGKINALRYQVDVNTLHRKNAPSLGLNEIGRCLLSMNEPIIFDAYRQNQTTGSLIIIDRLTNVTVGAAMILDRGTGNDQQDHWDDDPQSETLQTQLSHVSSQERTDRYGQQPATLLLTGLTGSGKTTLAYALERRLFDLGHACNVLDGQNMRVGISKDLGFTPEDRSENLRRTAEVAKLLNDAGLVCIAAFVAPSEEVRQRAAEVVGEDRFLVVHLDAPIEVCRERDEEGNYAKADRGEIGNFPGVTATYDIPQEPALTLSTDKLSVSECVDQILEMLQAQQFLS